MLAGFTVQYIGGLYFYVDNRQFIIRFNFSRISQKLRRSIIKSKKKKTRPQKLKVSKRTFDPACEFVHFFVFPHPPEEVRHSEADTLKKRLTIINNIDNLRIITFSIMSSALHQIR